MKHFRTTIHAGFVAVLGLMAAPVTAATVSVTNNNDDGEGSFRAAVEEANSDPAVDVIQFLRDFGTIDLETEPVIYDGPQSLTIDGQGTRIDSDIGSDLPGSFDLFVSTGGADLTIQRLTFRDGLNGIVVEVPADAVGEVSTSLREVAIANCGDFGLLVDDETNSSAASVGLSVESSQIAGNGRNIGDLDGVRVNERGEGHITANVEHSEFIRNGADGLELDEGGLGNVTLIARDSVFDRNGALEPEGDDGVDIDEAQEGNISAQITSSSLNRNTDDGIGMDESGDGNIHLSLEEVQASRNLDSGVSVDEGDAGDFQLGFNLVTADRNADDGADVEEAGAGNFDGRAVASSLSRNADDGISVTQEAPGDGVLRLDDVTLDRNGGEPLTATNVEVR